jgi:PAS domain S-box-containing protein
MNKFNYKNIFLNAPFGFAIHKIVLDELGTPIDYICLEINKAYENITGLSADDIVNRRITEVFPNIKTEKLNWIETAGKVALTGVSFETVEFVSQFKKWFRIKLYSPDKYYFVTTFTDVTEHKLEEKRNKELEELKFKEESQLHNIINTGAVYISKTNLEGEYTFYNKKYFDEFAWIFDNKDLIGKNSIFALHPSEKESTIKTIQKCIKNPGKYYQFELLQPERNGECKTFLWEFVCIKDIDNKPYELLCIGLDITERLKSERALKENEEKFRLIFENISDGILIFSPEKNITYSSPSYREMMGYKIDEIEGRNINDFYENIHPDDRVELFKNILSNIRYTYRIKHTNNYYIWREDHANLIYDEDGNHKSSYVICRDITKRKVFEEQLKQERDLFTSGPVVNIIWKISENWQIKYISTNCLEVMGFNQYELMSEDFHFNY